MSIRKTASSGVLDVTHCVGQGGHAHRLRNTLAVELLLAGVPIERVSVLLGHNSVKVTEKHYNPWVRSRQEQMEADIARTWKNGPIVLSGWEIYAASTR